MARTRDRAGCPRRGLWILLGALTLGATTSRAEPEALEVLDQGLVANPWVSPFGQHVAYRKGGRVHVWTRKTGETRTVPGEQPTFLHGVDPLGAVVLESGRLFEVAHRGTRASLQVEGRDLKGNGRASLALIGHASRRSLLAAVGRPEGSATDHVHFFHGPSGGPRPYKPFRHYPPIPVDARADVALSRRGGSLTVLEHSQRTGWFTLTLHRLRKEAAPATLEVQHLASGRKPVAIPDEAGRVWLAAGDLTAPDGIDGTNRAFLWTPKTGRLERLSSLRCESKTGTEAVSAGPRGEWVVLRHGSCDLPGPGNTKVRPNILALGRPTPQGWRFLDISTRWSGVAPDLGQVHSGNQGSLTEDGDTLAVGTNTGRVLLLSGLADEQP